MAFSSFHIFMCQALAKLWINIHFSDTSYSMTYPKPQANQQATSKMRNSNLELYRIICMMMIVAHHYVVNSGLNSLDGPLRSDFTSGNSLFLTIFGAWGKTGINCFMMITGYFMCKSQITLRKFVKLIAQIYLYRWILFPILLLMGYETISAKRLFHLAMPIWDLKHNFVSCFIVFWLTIPFLNILVHNLTKRQHELLLLLLLGCYTLLSFFPDFYISFNYVTWFVIIYFIASFIRLHPNPIFERKYLWEGATIMSLLLATISILFFRVFYGNSFGLGYFFVSDCNKFFSVVIAVCSFLWFKNIKIKYNKIINAFGAGTFGVLLIHANSNAMRTWLWKDTMDVVGHYSLSLGNLIIYSFVVVFVIFFICNLIDQVRIATLEKWLLQWYDDKSTSKEKDLAKTYQGS